MTIKDIGYLILWVVFVGLILLISFQGKVTEENLGAPVSPDLPRVATMPTKKQIEDGTKNISSSRVKEVIIEVEKE